MEGNVTNIKENNGKIILTISLNSRTKEDILSDIDDIKDSDKEHLKEIKDYQKILDDKTSDEEDKEDARENIDYYRNEIKDNYKRFKELTKEMNNLESPITIGKVEIKMK